MPYLYQGKYVRRGMNIGVVNEPVPIADDEPAPIVHDVIQTFDENLEFNRRQRSLYESRGAKNQAMNGMLLDQWPICNEEPKKRIRSKQPQLAHSSQKLQDRCCTCNDKCADNCPCAAKMMSCYSCNGSCSGNPFESKLFVDSPWLYTFDTDGRGKGVRSKVDLYPRNLVARYEGKRHSSPKEIQKVYDREGPNYALDLNETTIIDGLYGGVAKYINHSCEPNMGAFLWKERRLNRQGKVVTKDQCCFSCTEAY